MKRGTLPLAALELVVVVDRMLAPVLGLDTLLPLVELELVVVVDRKELGLRNYQTILDVEIDLDTMVAVNRKVVVVNRKVVEDRKVVVDRKVVDRKVVALVQNYRKILDVHIDLNTMVVVEHNLPNSIQVALQPLREQQ